MKQALLTLAFIVALALTSDAQTDASRTAQRGPSEPARPFLVLQGQTLADIDRKLRPENKTEELIGGQGMQLRVAVQHEKNKAAAEAEVHDASDDVYYVLEGTATLTLGGKLEAPREKEAGEWRSERIVGGQSFEIRKGDLVVVPRGTPHMRSTVGKDFTMILIKVFAEPLPAPQPKKAPNTKAQKN